LAATQLQLAAVCQIANQKLRQHHIPSLSSDQQRCARVCMDRHTGDGMTKGSLRQCALILRSTDKKQSEGRFLCTHEFENIHERSQKGIEGWALRVCLRDAHAKGWERDHSLCQRAWILRSTGQMQSVQEGRVMHREFENIHERSQKEIEWRALRVCLRDTRAKGWERVSHC
jgi:hypothetical protein